MLRLRIVNDLSASNEGVKRLIDQVLMGIDAKICLHGQTWTPQMDIYETPEAFVIIAEVAGLDPEDIEIVVDRSHVQIIGCRNQPSSSGPMLAHQIEIDYGNFNRKFRMSGPINPEMASATSEHGMLKIVLEKEPIKQKKIGVKRR